MMDPDRGSDVTRRALVATLGGALLASKLQAQPGAGDRSPPSSAGYLKAWNVAEKIELWPQGVPGAGAFRRRRDPAESDPTHILAIQRPALHVFRSPTPNGQALLVMPGGAYRFVSIGNEGVDVARRFNPAGVTVFVLTYRLPGEGWARRSDVPLQDAQRAMRVIRSRADAFGIRPERLAAVGFSAGGHLAASLATDHASRVYQPVDAADTLDAKPFAVGLIYPLILMRGPFTHQESRFNLLGPRPASSDEAARNPALHVGQDTPPVFLAHAVDDDAVPVDNSIAMMEACRLHHRPVEAHLFEKGRHAFGIGRQGTPSASWPDQFQLWLRQQG